MATPFASDAKLSASIDKRYAEQFRFEARTVAANDVDLPRIADASRPSFTASGTFEKPGKSAYPKARGSTADDNAKKWSAPRPSFCAADDALLWQPGKGDTAIRLFDGTVYEVGVSRSDGFGRTTIFLTARQQ